MKKWDKLNKINPNPDAWLMMYKHYLELLSKNPEFPNGFSSWYETFYEVVAGFYSKPDNEFLNKVENGQGRGGMWELAKDLTDTFEKRHKDTDWEDRVISYFEAVDEFLEEELK